MPSPHDLDPASRLTGAETEQLLARAAAGESDAWREIVAAFAPRLFGLLRSNCRDAELAEEIAQSTFCTVAAKIGEYQESGRFEAWLFRIAMNRLRDEMRRRSRHARTGVGSLGRDLVDETSGPPDPGASDLRGTLRRAMERLSEADREIIDLRHLGGMSFKELSEYYQEPVGTLLSRHHRALRKLRGLLESMGMDPGHLDDEGEAG